MGIFPIFAVPRSEGFFLIFFRGSFAVHEKRENSESKFYSSKSGHFSLVWGRFCRGWVGFAEGWLLFWLAERYLPFNLILSLV